ncbi:MAG: hypothetical protein ACI9Z3_001622 [Roseivirga sp.]|jgi:hypothetical protein
MKIEKTYSGEYPITQYSALFVFIGLELWLIRAAFLSDSLIGTLVFIAGALLIPILGRNAIRKVSFNEMHFEVKYLFGNSRTFEYNHVCQFYKNKEGFLSYYVFVLKTIESSKVRKSTFYVRPKGEEEIILHLQSKNIQLSHVSE